MAERSIVTSIVPSADDVFLLFCGEPTPQLRSCHRTRRDVAVRLKLKDGVEATCRNGHRRIGTVATQAIARAKIGPVLSARSRQPTRSAGGGGGGVRETAP